MCELLALNFNREISPVFSFVGLLNESYHHCHGWGLSYYPDDGPSAAVFKEAIAGYESELASFLTSYREMKSHTFIGHIRRSSIGNQTHANTHPFTKLFNGREWTFIHNGTLPDYPGSLKGMPYRPLGSTDSEYAFCKILSKMKKRKLRAKVKKNSHSYTRGQFAEIHQILKEINVCGDGPFNCIFSDSKYLFCYRDQHGARNLYYLQRQYPFDTTLLRDQDFEINLNLMKNDSDTGYVIATDHLTDEEWTSFSSGQLMVFKDGRIVANLN